MSTRRVAVGGLPYFGRMLASLLSGPGWEFHYVELPRRNPGAWARALATIARADAVYLVGGQIERRSRPDWLALAVRRPIVMHWVGSDVSYALDVARKGRGSSRLAGRPVHWAEVEWTAAELEPLDIKADVVPLTSARLRTAQMPLPESFTVLTYLPPARPEFYGRSRVFRIAARLPNVRFLVAGHAGPDASAPPNIEFLGWVTAMDAVYARCSVLLRLTDHDGLSFMVLEALAAGRYAIWNHPLSGVIEAGDESEALAALQDLQARQRRGELGPNDCGREAVLRRYAAERVRGEILSRFAAIVS
jgi:glycosyltransferase involved in cell wall biosynthesis